MLPALAGPMSGMFAQQQAIDVIAANLANVNTTGYRARHVEFHDLLQQHLPLGASSGRAVDEPLGGAGRSSGLLDLLTAGVRVGAIAHSFEPGRVIEDADPYHLAIEGEGFFVVQTVDGGAAYTRDGSFKLDSIGRLVTANGDVVLPETRIPADATDIRIDDAGLVMARLVAEDGTEFDVVVGEVQLARFVNPHGLAALGGNLFSATDASGDPIVGYSASDGLGRIRAGALETSNVDIAEQMTAMLIGQRAYGLSARVLQSLDEMLGLANNLRR
ncbi:MAG: flagellar hook-basal body complex protein [Chloroflexi bacterium]|nr:flagellar hook-basal body complex protein [Chloroflexota bacterium]